MATKRENVNDPSSCLNKAREDEPIFILRAHDRVAPAAVRDWAHRAHANGNASQLKVDGAMEVALEMERWQRQHGFKDPD